MTAAAQAQADDEPVMHPPTERQVGERWRHHQGVGDRERSSLPNGTPAQTPAPVPAKQSGQPGWLIASLIVLVAALALAGGLAILAARRTRRRARLEHAT